MDLVEKHHQQAFVKNKEQKQSVVLNINFIDQAVRCLDLMYQYIKTNKYK